MRKRNRLDRIANRTARRFSKELDRMCADLDDMDAPSVAFELALIELKHLQPHLFGALLFAMSSFVDHHTTHAAVVPSQTADGETLH